jgi:hypothetical protein
VLACGHGDVRLDFGVIIGSGSGTAGSGESPIPGGAPIDVGVLSVHVPLLVLSAYLYKRKWVRGIHTRALIIVRTRTLTENCLIQLTIFG